MSVTPTGGPTKCTLCLRTKEEALQQQKDLHNSCGHPNCPFKSEIEEILREPPFKIAKRDKGELPPMKITKR